MSITREPLNHALLATLLCSLVVACGSGVQEPASPAQEVPEEAAPRSRAVTPPTVNLPMCCANYEELSSHDGERVQIHGIYTKTNVSRRPPPLDLSEPGNAMVATGAIGVMLEIYYQQEGTRSLEEIQNFHGKAVVVMGTLHQRTPSQTHEGAEMQTMIGPYIEVESLYLAPLQASD